MSKYGPSIKCISLTGVIGPLREVARVWKSLSGLKTKMKEVVVLLKRPRSLWTFKNMDQKNKKCSL